MRRGLPKLLPLLALVAWAAPVHAQDHAQTQAQTPIYRCVGEHGEPKFSGQPCGTPVTVPGANADTHASQGHVLGDACPASPGSLRQAIAGAFETRDVNRLAGLILWQGMDEASARAKLRVLADWLKQPLAGIAVASAVAPTLADTSAAPAASVDGGGDGAMAAQPPSGFRISTGGDDGSTRDFGVTESGGCWWLTFQ